MYGGVVVICFGKWQVIEFCEKILADLFHGYWETKKTTMKLQSSNVPDFLFCISF